MGVKKERTKYGSRLLVPRCDVISGCTRHRLPLFSCESRISNYNLDRCRVKQVLRCWTLKVNQRPGHMLDIKFLFLYHRNPSDG